MKATASKTSIRELITGLSECLTPESARKVLALKASPTVQARVNELAGRCKEGELSSDEQSEYREYVSYSTFIAILKSKARQLLANPEGEK